MKRRLVVISLVFGSLVSLYAVTEVVTLEEQQRKEQIEAARKSGFADIEINNLHSSIAKNINEIVKLLNDNVDKKTSRYVGKVPEEPKPFMLTDAEGKKFLEFDLGLGESYANYPETYLYYSKAFIYPGEGSDSLGRIIMQFKRTNSRGTIFVREMRRLINDTPKGVEVAADGKRVPDDNSDIQLQYFSSYDTNTLWPDTPTLQQQPSVSFPLNDPKNPLPYEKQKLIIYEYKKLLRKIDKIVAGRLNSLVLDEKRLVSKMLEFR